MLRVLHMHAMKKRDDGIDTPSRYRHATLIICRNNSMAKGRFSDSWPTYFLFFPVTTYREQFEQSAQKSDKTRIKSLSRNCRLVIAHNVRLFFRSETSHVPKVVYVNFYKYFRNQLNNIIRIFEKIFNEIIVYYHTSVICGIIFFSSSCAHRSMTGA